jgi:hypothetical protein
MNTQLGKVVSFIQISVVQPALPLVGRFVRHAELVPFAGSLKRAILRARLRCFGDG